MTDSVASRVSRIVAEEQPDPAAIDSLIDEVRAGLEQAVAAGQRVQSRIAGLEAEHARLTEQSHSALVAGRDDLAAAAIARQADIEDLLPVLQAGQDEQTARTWQHERLLNALLARQRELARPLADEPAEGRLRQRIAERLAALKAANATA